MSSPQNQPRPEKTSPLDRLFRPNVTQDEFEREFFELILERNDSHAEVLRRQAELLARHGDYQGALRLDRRLIELHPDDPIVHYNAACSLAQTGHRVEAIGCLTRAIELGYGDFAHIEADADLDGLRDEPSFQELLRRHGISDG